MAESESAECPPGGAAPGEHPEPEPVRRGRASGAKAKKGAAEKDGPSMESPSPDEEPPPRGLMRVLCAVVLVGARRPVWSISIAAIVFLVAAALVPGLQISTSRSDLVDKNNPHQRRLIAFHERFGVPDEPVVVLTGGTPDARRGIIDKLAPKLEAVPELQGRVLARMSPETAAEVMLLADPSALVKSARAVAKAGGDAPPDIPAIIEGGLPAWLDGIGKEVGRGLDDPNAKIEDADKGFEGLTTLIRALDDEVQGKSSVPRLAELAKSADRGPMARSMDELGYLTGSGDHHVVALFPEIQGDEGYQVTPLVQKIRKVRDEAVAEAPGSGVEVDVTGLPALVADELRIVERDLAVTSTASTLFVMVALYWAFRSVRQATVSFLPLGFGTLVTFAAARLLVGKLNLITTSFTSVLLGLGDFGVHIQARYAELLRNGMPRQRAMETALLKAGPGLLAGTVMTAVAFATTMVTEFTAFAQLGLITCIGLLVLLCGTYLLIPPVVMLVLGKAPKPAPELWGMRATARLARRWPRGIVIGSVLFTLVFLPFAFKVDFNGRYFDFLPKKAESARGLVTLEHDQVLSPIIANVTAENVEEARRLTEKLRALPAVASVESATDLLPPLDDQRANDLREIDRLIGRPIDFAKLRKTTVSKEEVQPKLTALADVLDEASFAMHQAGRDTKRIDEAKAALADVKKHLDEQPDGGKARLTDLQLRASNILERAIGGAHAVAARGAYAPTDIPLLWQHRFLSKDKRALAIYVHPKGDIWDEKIAAEFARQVASVSENTSGLAMTLSEHPKMIVRGFERATLLAAALVVVVLFFAFRNLKDMLVAAVPLVMGSICMLGAMPLLGLHFNHANMVVLPLLLGLGVDAGVHIMIRWRQSAEERGGVGELDEMMVGTGTGVFIASLTTIFGFGVMLFADYRAMFSLGLIMSIGMTITVGLSLVVIPAILLLQKRAR
jgi:predicted RND superfamily exporter protein